MTHNVIELMLRQMFLFVHLIAFAFAFVTVAREDWAMFRATRLKVVHLSKVAEQISWLLLVLWVSGIALILLDVGFDFGQILVRPKLAAKLTVVSLLTLNGLLIHKVVIRKIAQSGSGSTSYVCALVGAISSVSWLYASFVGASRLIAPAMNYATFIALYGVALLVGVLVSLIYVRPHMEQLIANPRSV